MASAVSQNNPIMAAMKPADNLFVKADKAKNLGVSQVASDKPDQISFKVYDPETKNAVDITNKAEVQDFLNKASNMGFTEAAKQMHK